AQPRSFSLPPCHPCPRLRAPVTLGCHQNPNENLGVEAPEMPAQTARAPTPQPPILLQENVGSIRLLTLNRPAARNSLSEGLIAELHAALKQIHDENSVRAVVIAANGPAFSAGHDMKELTARRSDADRGRGDVGHIINGGSAMMQAVVLLPKPVVAAVQG